MLEEQDPKILTKVYDEINNLYTRKPLVLTIVTSLVVGVAVMIVGLGWESRDTKMEVISEPGNDFALKSTTNAALNFKDGYISVDLSGAVKSPGIYKLAANSRLSDLIAEGGGFISDVSSLWVSRNLNLAQPLSDGTKVYVPFDWDISQTEDDNVVFDNSKALSLGGVLGSDHKDLSSDIPKTGGVLSNNDSDPDAIETTDSTQQPATNKVNVNTASLDKLDELPGIGPAYASKIVENRPYSSYSDFIEKSSLSASLCEKLKELISY